MNKVLVITGPAESGKSFLMRQIAGDNAILISGDRSIMERQFLFEDFKPRKTKYVCFDGVSDLDVLRWIVMHAFSRSILIEKRGEKCIDTPNKDIQFIIVANISLDQIGRVSDQSLMRRVNVIELKDCSMRMNARNRRRTPSTLLSFGMGGFDVGGLVFASQSCLESSDTEQPKTHYADAMEAYVRGRIVGRTFSEVLNSCLPSADSVKRERNGKTSKIIDELGVLTEDFKKNIRTINTFKEWADGFFSKDGLNVNSFVSREKAYMDYIFNNPKYSLSGRKFVEILRFHAKKRGWTFNPEHSRTTRERIIRKSKRMKYNGRDNTWKELPGASVAKEFFYIQTQKN